MCGIAGILNLTQSAPVDPAALRRAIGALRHRGPDGFGFLERPEVGLAHARLSIIDLEGGWQPLSNEDGDLWIVFNGEIFNYPELREQLEARGHRFATRSDTEVIIHLFEEKGERCVEELNGQFAFAIWDERRRRLFLARDRMGIRPLFHAFHDGRFLFASEAKALFAADPTLPRRLDPDTLASVLTFWMPVGDASAFCGVRQLAPGHTAFVSAERGFEEREYWDLPMTSGEDGGARSEEDWAEGLRELLIDAVRLQLRADVPVGAYLSGGLDSAAIAALVRRYTGNRLKTFSVAFEDEAYDERREQAEVSDHLGAERATISCGYEDIARVFRRVVWHAETPVIRTAPAPLFLLSGLVREHGYKVVLTGEGADELLGGYDLFKEAKIRAFVRRNLGSAFRPLLLRRLYPYLVLKPTESAAYAAKFFDTAADPADPFYAHRPRWRLTAWTHAFLRPELRPASPEAPVEALVEAHGAKLSGMDFFSAAQYLETKTLLAGYLLSSQGDRMAMAHSVEGRFPFLDHRVAEYACRVPLRYRMKALREKNLLKKALADLLPPGVLRRTKRPYMAPDILSFSGETGALVREEFLSPRALEDAGLFRPEAVGPLLAKCAKNARQGFRENMAFVGVLSAQMLHHVFIRNFDPEPFPEAAQNIRRVR